MKTSSRPSNPIAQAPSKGPTTQIMSPSPTKITPVQHVTPCPLECIPSASGVQPNSMSH